MSSAAGCHIAWRITRPPYAVRESLNAEPTADAPRSKTPADGKENGSVEKRPKLDGSSLQRRRHDGALLLMCELAAASTSTPTPTPTPAPAPLVELRGRKLIFRQEPLPIKYPKRREPRYHLWSGVSKWLMPRSQVEL